MGSRREWGENNDDKQHDDDDDGWLMEESRDVNSFNLAALSHMYKKQQHNVDEMTNTQQTSQFTRLIKMAAPVLTLAK